MSGTSRGFITMTVVGARVGGEPTYYPAHSKNGVNVDQRVQVRAVVNIPSKANQGNGETIGMNIVGWGKLADVLARSCANGKELHLELMPNVYKGQVYFKDPNDKTAPIVAVSMNTPSGQVPVKVEKTSYRIKKIVFGADSNEQIKREEQSGFRAQGWQVAGSPAALALGAALKNRNAEQYDPSKAKFGFANVRKIEGPEIGPYDHTKTRAQATSTAKAIQTALAAAPALPAPAAPAAPQVPAAAPAPSTAVIAGL